jgi:hypothetical protein
LKIAVLKNKKNKKNKKDRRTSDKKKGQKDRQTSKRNKKRNKKDRQTSEIKRTGRHRKTGYQKWADSFACRYVGLFHANWLANPSTLPLRRRRLVSSAQRRAALARIRRQEFRERGSAFSWQAGEQD